MKADAFDLTKILYGNTQYIIPLFQRYYSWKKDHWQRLRNDIWDLMAEESERAHFMGPLVCTPLKQGPGHVAAFQLIDGQQRLTTLTLLLISIRDTAKECGLEKLHTKITDKFLIEPHEEDLERYRLLPRLGDRETLLSLVDGEEPGETKSLLFQAYRYFKRHVEHLARKDAKDSLNALLNVVTQQLMLVVVTIDGEDPYEIFESLNSTGLPLEESDLIRNFVFMQIPMQEQSKFYAKEWKPFEDRFTQVGEGEDAISATGFYRDYLMRNGEYVRLDGTFATFKSAMGGEAFDASALVKDLSTFLTYAKWIQNPFSHPDNDLQEALETLKLFEVRTANSLVMHIFHLHGLKQITENELLQMLQDLASFVLRRSICGETTRSYGTWFVEAIPILQPGAVLDSFRSYFLKRGWPSDRVFRERLKDFPIYKRESLKTLRLLRFLERDMGHKEKVELDNLTIEHVLPQTLSKEESKDETGWKAMLGVDWKVDHEVYLHTLGNLTLTAYNSELGNRSYSFKKAEYAKSHVELNSYFAKVENWNREAILQRCDDLSDRIIKAWPVPGDDYKALPKVPVGLTPVKQRRIDYWSGLAENLSELETPVQLIDVKPETQVYAEFPGGVTTEFWAWFYNREKLIRIGITFKGKMGKVWLKTLMDEKETIEKEVGYSLNWMEDSSHAISWTEHHVTIFDREDWYIQHATLAEVMSDLYRVLAPRVEKLMEDTDVVVSDTQQMHSPYWDALLQHLNQQNSPLKMRSTADKNEALFKLSSSFMGLGAKRDTKHSKLCVFFYLRYQKEEAAVAAYRHLQSMKEEIEAQWAESPEWDDMPGCKAKRLVLWFPGEADPEEAGWSEQFDWLQNQLERMDKVFRPLFNQFSPFLKLAYSESEKFRVKYWASFTNFAAQYHPSFAFTYEGPDSWTYFSLGSGAQMVFVLNTGVNYRIGLSFALNSPSAVAKYYAHLLSNRSLIEAKLGFSLNWDPKEGNKIGRDVRVWREDFNPSDQSSWLEQHQWMLETAGLIRDTFKPYLIDV